MFAPTLAQPAALPAPVRRSPRRSLDLAPQLSTRPTPRARSQPPIATPADENVKSATTHSTFDANTSAKRRKLDTDSTATRSTRSSFPRRDIYTLNAEEEPEASAADTTNGSVGQSFTQIERLAESDISTLFIPESGRTPTPPLGEVEITESPSHAPGSGHRRRTLTGPAVKGFLQDELQNERAVQNERLGSPTPQKKRKRRPSVPDTSRSRRSRASVSNASIDLDVSLNENELDELSPDQPRRGRRRKSSIQRESIDEPVVAESADERETAEEIENAEAAAILKKNRGGRRLSRHVPAEPSPDLDEPSEQSPIVQKKGVMKKKGRKQRDVVVPKQQHQPRQNPVSSPAQQGQPKAASKPSKKTAKKQAMMGSPIPVTAYRLTKGTTYDEDESDADILNAEIPYAKRGGVNVIDVLSQICQEVISSSLDTIQEHSRNAQDKAAKREFRDKQRYVEAYGRELQTRLLEHVSMDFQLLYTADIFCRQSISTTTSPSRDVSVKSTRRRWLSGMRF